MALRFYSSGNNGGKANRYARMRVCAGGHKPPFDVESNEFAVPPDECVRCNRLVTLADLQNRMNIPILSKWWGISGLHGQSLLGKVFLKMPTNAC